MIRVVLFFVLVGLLAAGAGWLADRPGDLVLNWQGYRIEFSVMTAAAVLLLAVGAIVLLWSLLAGVIAGPGMLTGMWRLRRKEKGYAALTQGIIAVSAGDARAAAKFSSQANKVVADQPLALLLKAQTAQLRGDRAGARRAFEAMLKSPQTQSLGLRGLFIEAQRRNDNEAAQAFAQRALDDERSTEWAAEALFDMQSAAGNWDAALATLATNLRHKLIDKSTAQRQRAVLLTGQAMQLEDSDPEATLQMALEANGLAPDLVPAAVIAGRLLGHQGQTRKAIRILEQVWQKLPHPELADVYANVRPGDSVRDRLQRVINLAASTSGDPVGAMSVAEAAIDALDWKTAREVLEPHLVARPSQRICTLMAEIEEGEHGDRGRAREWLSRAVRAPRDPAWTADGIVSPVWAPVSPVTGRIDAFEWKMPVERIGGYDNEDIDEDVISATPIDDVTIEAGEAELIEDVEDIPLDDPMPADQATGDNQAKPDNIDGDQISANLSEDDVKNLLKTGKKKKIPRAPDDPGPEAAAMVDEDATYRGP